MRFALAVGSFVVLFVHGLVFYDQFRNRWEDHQKAYFNQARVLAKTDAERAALDERQPKIEQTIVTSFGDTRVDRCQTCHIAVDDPRFTTYQEPIRTHPYSEAMGDVFRNGRWERRHKFADFGCTSCHDGQGRGLKADDAHGEDPFWPEPMLGYVMQTSWKRDYKPHLLGKEYLQANCAQCHTEQSFPGTQVVAHGRELFFRTGCYGCHRIDGLSNGTLGPDLTQEGKLRKVDFTWEKITDPRISVPQSFMPQFKLSEADKKALVIFLKSRRGMNFAETALDRYRLKTSTAVPPPGGPEPQNVSRVARGERLVQDRACVSCHKLGDKDGGIAPDLSYEGLMRDDAWLMDHFRNPRSRVPDSVMPAFGFPDEEFQAITAYLKTRATQPKPMTAAETYSALCARCHGDKGDGNGMSAIYLDPAPRDFTKTAFMVSKPEARFLQSIREGVPGTSMPVWGKVLNDQQIKAVFDHVWQTYVREQRKELKARSVPDHNPVLMSADSTHRGEGIFLQRCSGCHGRKADGKGPNSVDITPRPRNLRNAAFVERAPDRRLFESIMYGVEGTAMPPWVDYGLSQNDVGDLVNFIRSLTASKAAAPQARGSNAVHRSESGK